MKFRYQKTHYVVVVVVEDAEAVAVTMAVREGMDWELKPGKKEHTFSRKAVTRLAQKINTNTTQKLSSPPPSSPPSSASSAIEYGGEETADILPEILKHSLPPKIFHQQTAESTLSTAPRWVLHVDPKNFSSVSPDALNPLRAYVSLPQVTFGPKRWELPNVQNSVSASTANELRCDRYPTPINPEKLKAAAEGLSQIGKAFAVATAAIFGGATLILGLAVSKLELHNSDDIRTKGRDLVQPKLDIIREQLVPIRTWAERWQVQREKNIKEKPIIIEKLTKILGPRSSN